MIRFFAYLFIFLLLLWCVKTAARYYLMRWINSKIPKHTMTINSEALLQCSLCHTFVPQSQAFVHQERYYCSEEHARNQ